MREFVPNDDDLHFIYGRIINAEIDSRLLYAQEKRRVSIYEYKNFKDYDILPLIRSCLVLLENNRIKTKLRRKQMKGD